MMHVRDSLQRGTQSNMHVSLQLPSRDWNMPYWKNLSHASWIYTQNHFYINYIEREIISTKFAKKQATIFFYKSYYEVSIPPHTTMTGLKLSAW